MPTARLPAGRLILPLLTCFALACGGEAPSVLSGQPLPVPCRERPLQWSGTEGAPTDAAVIANVFAVPASVDGVTSQVVVDTGAPLTLLDPASYAAADIPRGVGQVSSLETLGLSFPGARVLGMELPLTFGGVVIGGLLGSDVLCHFSTSFNYRDAQVTLGDSVLPTGVAPARSLPFTLQGGGLGAIGEAVTAYPPTRIVVTARVEGHAYDFVVDTGASLTLISPSLYQRLVKDGRGRLEGLQTSTVTGDTSARVTRVRSFQLEGVDIRGELVAEAGDLYAEALSAEVGRPVEGLLGGSILRHFFVTADYAAGELRLAPYETAAHVRDEFRRLGMVLARADEGGYRVRSVLPDSDAEAQGLQAGDEVHSIDGTALRELGAEQVDVLLRGEVGTSKVLQLASRMVTVKVEEQLPLPLQ